MILKYYYYLIIGEAIRCYECNSYYDIHCADDKPPAHFDFECSSRGSEFTFCRKTVQSIGITVNTCKLLDFY